MSYDDFFAFALFLAFTIMLSLGVAKTLRTSQLEWGGIVYQRRGQPIEFWSYVVYAAIGIAMLLWLLVEKIQGASRPRAEPFVLLSICVIPAAFWLIRGVQTGSTGFGGSRLGRREAPWRYWGLLLAYAAFAALALWLLIIPAGRSGTAFGEVVEPVVEAVRHELRAQPSLAFRNVRVDEKSRLVCGEVEAKGRTTRFFGKAVAGDAKVALEGRSLNFEPAYRRACGAPGHVPPQG